MYNFTPIKIKNGTLELLKWLGMIFMTLDHANRFLFNSQSYSAYCWGRLAMPLFAFVFAYNLANRAFNDTDYTKTFLKLLFFGLLATPAYRIMLMIPGIFPLNILFTFFVIAGVIFLFEAKQVSLAVILLLVGGFLVDYYWFGVLLGLACWLVCRTPCWPFLFLSLVACALLYWVNANNWALLAIPIIFMATYLDVTIPRYRYLFWLYYPGHLSVLWVIKMLSNSFY